MIDIIWQENNFRIIEVNDCFWKIEDLKGDCFNQKVNSDIDPKQLEKEEISFQNKVNEEGIFGYVLEKWYPEVDTGWTEIDSCYGFVGKYQDYNHYIVSEFKNRIGDI